LIRPVAMTFLILSQYEGTPVGVVLTALAAAVSPLNIAYCV
jgi:hypothetical protein